jgi:hypothetical protein
MDNDGFTEEIPLIEEILPPKPKTRGDCAAGPRPCPWVRCRYHLLVDRIPGILRHRNRVTKNRGRLGHGAIALTDLDAITDALFAMPHTCVLDQIADPMTLDEVGLVIGLTRERVRQLEVIIRAKLGLKGFKHDHAT